MNWIVRAIATLVILPVSGGLLCACQSQNFRIFANQKMADYFYDRGLERLGSQDYQGAIANFNQVIKRQSSNYQAYSQRCIALIKIGEVTAAKADCDRAVQINPKDGDVRSKRAYFRYFVGDKRGAIEDLLMAASIYRQEGSMPKYQEAIENYQKYAKEIVRDNNI